MQWQLPFSFSPSDVVAVFSNGEVNITLPKPNPVSSSFDVCRGNELTKKNRVE